MMAGNFSQIFLFNKLVVHSQETVVFRTLVFLHQRIMYSHYHHAWSGKFSGGFQHKCQRSELVALSFQINFTTENRVYSFVKFTLISHNFHLNFLPIFVSL